MYKICLVEDEEDLNHLITTYLKKEGYEVVSLTKGVDALEYLKTGEVHLWILDIMLKDSVSGYDIIKQIRTTNQNVPVIFTSARDQDLDKIIGLELGSDDYITKPYSPKELILRVNNMMRRIYATYSNKIKYENYEIDLDKRLVYEQDKEIVLTSLEYDLLLLFLENRNQSFSRDAILKRVWGEDYFGSDRVVDDLVRRLRNKMKALHINTIYGFGYRLI